MKGILIRNEQGIWNVKWSDLHSFGHGTHWMFTELSSDSNSIKYIKDNLEFDQLIWEFGDDTNPSWVHVSYKANGKQRKQILKAIKKNGDTKYIPYK